MPQGSSEAAFSCVLLIYNFLDWLETYQDLAHIYSANPEEDSEPLEPLRGMGQE
jgi:hypothetical protein